MSTVRMRVAVVLVAVLGTGGGLVAAGPAAAAAAPGSVLSDTILKATELPSDIARIATGKRIVYYTTDVNGTVISASGLVLTPKEGKNNKTVAWGHGTTGLADKCAPSGNLAVFWPEAVAAVTGLLKRGWTVAAPDYAGLGVSARLDNTPLPHPYFIGLSEARAVIDSVRAARNLDRQLSTQYVVDGHSEGGQAALFTSELAPSYDGDLVLRGVVAIAPVSNVDYLAPYIPGTPNQGYMVMALTGLATVDPSIKVETLLAKPADDLLPVLESGCLVEILDRYAPLTAQQLLTGGTLPQSVVDKLGRWDNPAQSPPSAPILLVQGTADAAVPYDVTAGMLLPELQAYSSSVELKVYDGADHEQAVFQSVSDVGKWIAARFS